MWCAGQRWQRSTGWVAVVNPGESGQVAADLRPASGSELDRAAKVLRRRRRSRAWVDRSGPRPITLRPLLTAIGAGAANPKAHQRWAIRWTHLVRRRPPHRCPEDTAGPLAAAPVVLLAGRGVGVGDVGGGRVQVGPHGGLFAVDVDAPVVAPVTSAVEPSSVVVMELAPSRWMSCAIARPQVYLIRRTGVAMTVAASWLPW